MADRVATALAFAEQDFIRSADGLGMLADTLIECGSTVPECFRAAHKVRKLAGKLLRILHQLDPHIAGLVREGVRYEEASEEEPPF